MRSFRTFCVATVWISFVVLATSHSANSGEKRCRVKYSQPTQVACTSSDRQPAAPTQTCCQPAAASVQPQIELVAYTRPASPRLKPQPDPLDTRKTLSDTCCAQFMVMDYGSYQFYSGMRCSNNFPVGIYGSGLAPLPGNCGNPNGACVTTGSSVIPTAFNPAFSNDSGSVIQKGVHLAQKRKAGEQPRTSPNAAAKGPHQLKERSQVGEPIYAKFSRPGRGQEFVIVELQKYFVRGTGKSSEEFSGTFAVGTEIDAVPVGKQVQVIDPANIQIVTDHVARLVIGKATYDAVTATKLVP